MNVLMNVEKGTQLESKKDIQHTGFFLPVNPLKTWIKLEPSMTKPYSLLDPGDLRCNLQ